MSGPNSSRTLRTKQLRRQQIGFTIFTALLLALFLFDFARDYYSGRHQQTAIGVVLDQLDDNRGHHYHYRYSVGGALFEGWNSSWQFVADGQPIKVYYDKTNPARSSLTSFVVKAESEIGPVPVFLLIFGSVIWFAGKFTGSEVRAAILNNGRCPSPPLKKRGEK